MTKVIDITMSLDEQRRRAEIEQEISKKEQEIAESEQTLKDLENEKILLDVEIEKADKREKAELKKERVTKIAAIKLLKQQTDTLRATLTAIKTELAKIKAANAREYVKQNTEDTTVRVFDLHNIHYVIMEQQWYSVDPTNGRMDLKLNSSPWGVVRDLIYHDSDWEISNEQELKKLAKQHNRMYKHIVRDFHDDSKFPRPGIYNQMTTIRQQWLTPTYGQQAHEAFRILMLSIAGGDEDYADQLERMIAYRYCHPEDVMIPSIDSCAVGGTGRDTLFNIIRSIFTDECCGSAGTETFKGTHNSDLFGKMFMKIDEKNSVDVPIDRIKEFLGGHKYRHRAMGQDPRDVNRLFTFLFFRNGFTTTARLAGTGSAGEDRRFEPFIARVNLPKHIALHAQLIGDLSQTLAKAEETACQLAIKEWQRSAYQNEEQQSIWLGHIIEKHDAKNMSELLPLHGKYYHEMLQRQKRGIDGFMPKIMNLMKDSNVFSISQLHKIYEVAENHKCSKDWFKNSVMYWLNTQASWDCEETNTDVYTWVGCPNSERRKMQIIRNRLNVPNKPMFSIDDFIDREALDDKGTTVGEKINIFSIRDELR